MLLTDDQNNADYYVQLNRGMRLLLRADHRSTFRNTARTADCFYL
jgi:hypothetical protein